MLKTTVEQYKHMKTGKKKGEHGVADLVIIDNNKTMYKKCIYFFRNMNDGKIVNFTNSCTFTTIRIQKNLNILYNCHVKFVIINGELINY